MPDDRLRIARWEDELRTDMPLGHRMHRFAEALQLRIVREFERIDGEAEFSEDRWEHHQGGGGVARVIQDGAIWEKGGVNVSAVEGMLPERMATAFGVVRKPFFATGISLVMNPRNPFVPAVHANFRYFALGEDLTHPDDQWFGGGADMTPYYGTIEDARHFHSVWKQVCDEHHEVADYAAFKRACDDYFYLPHRKEARGVGGIFFDYMREEPELTFLFVRNAGRAFLSSYVPIVERNRGRSYGDRERTYQELRRGRYAEFNLAYDRGTRFGLETGGRTESILMSLPPVVQWAYDWKPEPGSEEEAAAWFYHARDWLDDDIAPPGSYVKS